MRMQEKSEKWGATSSRSLVLNENQVKQMVKMYYEINVDIDEICDCFEISKSTLYRYLLLNWDK